MAPKPTVRPTARRAPSPDAGGRSSRPLKLKALPKTTVSVRGPFDAKTTLVKPSHFPSPFELPGEKDYRFATRIGEHIVAARIPHQSGGNRVVIELFVPVGTALEDETTVADEVARRLGLTLDLGGYEAIWRSDSTLRRLPSEMLGARPSSPFNLYEFLTICVLLQNTTVHRTVQMANALAEEFGSRLEFDDGSRLTTLPTPVQIAKAGEQSLRDLRLGYRAKSLTRLAEQFIARPRLEQDLIGVRDTASLRSALLELYGVGPASVGYILFEWFKCLDDFAHVSPWERQILSRLLFGRSSASEARIIQFCKRRWSPFTMLGAHAVFESVFWRRAQGAGPGWLDELIRL